jgi:aryl-alcohol dehydrogenase-like predicted oxidoreductase
MIPGTASLEHLRQNLDAVELRLPPEILADLDSIAASIQKDPAHA